MAETWQIQTFLDNLTHAEDLFLGARYRGELSDSQKLALWHKVTLRLREVTNLIVPYLPVVDTEENIDDN